MSKKQKEDAGAEPEITAEENISTAEQKPAESSPEQQIADLKDQLLRALAEVQNVTRRAAIDKQETAKYAVSNFARDVLGVSDNFRRALQSIPDNSPLRSDPVAAAFITGVEMTENELLATLKRHGIQEVTPKEGDKFDANRHQAMMEMDHPTYAAGTIVHVMQAGYMIGDRLLRPAMVGVAKGGGAQKVDTKV